MRAPIIQPPNWINAPATAINTLLTTTNVPTEGLPLSDAMAFFREAIGGQLVVGARTLLSGWPGSGKSRVSSQLCLDLGLQDVRSLTILTEESPSQLKRRTMQMCADMKPADAKRSMGAMQVEAGVYDVASLPEFLVRQVLSPTGAYHGVRLIVLDSIQSHGLHSTSTKTYAKVLEFARLCEVNGISTLLLCHVTKRGDIAGPKTLEHSVDTSLILRRAMLYSLLGVRKNRYGPPLLKPMPLRFNPVSIRLEPAPHCEAKPAMARTFAGAGSGMLEMQAAVTVPSAENSRGRMTAPGLPRREIEQLLGCIASMPNMDFDGLDYSIHCRLPGNGVYHPVFGLPLCMALLGSYIRHGIPERNIYMGEIDLFRNVRAIPPNLLMDLRAALDGGDISLPVTLYLPVSAVGAFASSSAQVKVVGCKTLQDAVLQTWPDLH